MLSLSVTWVCDKCNCSIDCVQLLISLEFCEIIPYAFITCVRLLQHVFVELIEQTVCFTLETGTTELVGPSLVLRSSPSLRFVRFLENFVLSLDRNTMIPLEICVDDV